MPAIPLIATGVGAAANIYQAKKASQSANQQKDLMRQQSALANEMGGFARQQHSMAEPALSKAMQHYMTLATGNRGAIGAELAPDVNAVTEASRGAERGMERTLTPGPQRDRAIAELYRQRAGQIGLMPFTARQQAFAGMENAGQQRMNSAISAYQGANQGLVGAAQTGLGAAKLGQQAADMWGQTIGGLGQFGLGAYDWYRKSRGGGGGFPGIPGGQAGPF